MNIRDQPDQRLWGLALCLCLTSGVLGKTVYVDKNAKGTSAGAAIACTCETDDEIDKVPRAWRHARQPSRRPLQLGQHTPNRR